VALNFSHQQTATSWTPIFAGDFIAVNLETEEEFTSQKAIFPEELAKALQAAISGKFHSPVVFAVVVSAELIKGKVFLSYNWVRPVENIRIDANVSTFDKKKPLNLKNATPTKRLVK
jgi:hypothetical protein